MKTTVIHHSNVFGPHDKFDLERSHVLGSTIRKVIDANEGDDINVWGSGRARRDFIFINDLISFIEKAYFNQPEDFGLYNCGMGYSLSINELVEKIISISEKNLTLKNDLSKPDIPTSLSLDCKKPKQSLNGKTLQILCMHLRKLIDGHKRNMDDINLSEIIDKSLRDHYATMSFAESINFNAKFSDALKNDFWSIKM